jgi:HPt (histidine-containing phosphotransfer) domain-containing protein
MSSQPRPAKSPWLKSQLLAGEDGLRDVVGDFVRGLDGRLAELRRAYDALDWGLLGTLTQRLKGASGSYGYPAMSQICAQMEQAFRVHRADAFAGWIAELERLVSAARDGLGPTA